jgi:hypothetical protein
MRTQPTHLSGRVVAALAIGMLLLGVATALLGSL